MIQGLLGGFRVKLNELVGTDLAAFHGVFAQVVCGLVVSVAVLTRRPRPVVEESDEPRLGGWAFALAALIFVQVIFGAWTRHYPAPLPQRLHFLTAFAATALAVWLLRAVFVDAAARREPVGSRRRLSAYWYCSSISVSKPGWRGSASTRSPRW